ncbi:MAG: LacI family DNA-binding transcriptional regulator [Acidobacteria bacterium]|nr:LacI family DNA-binding transcriptional regulator [Acidobacteriota bacterium]
MAIRLKDIARDLGVSTVTVSKVLRGNSDISEKTRERVLKRMREVNYQPNMLARGLASGRTYTVGLVVPDLVHPFFAEFAKSLSGVLRQSNRALLLASSEEDAEMEQQEIRTLLSRSVDVLLIASCQPRLMNFYELGDERTPFLLVDRNFPYLAAHFVGSDDYQAGRLATKHLIDIGKTRIAHIGGRTMSPSLERMRGYRDMLGEARIESPEKYIVTLERFEETGDTVGYQAMKSLLKLKPRPDAVFCYNDMTAIGAMEAATEAGLRIPEDIAFIGCGNLRYDRYLRMPLSSIDQNSDALGTKAGELAIELANNATLPPKSVLLEPKLVIRQSTTA